jgi:hypothetical protein
MARNIEIKARIESVEAMSTKAAALADQGPIEMLHDDTFFMCERGRLKLRAFSAIEGQLIFYQRPNQTGPRNPSLSFLRHRLQTCCVRRFHWPMVKRVEYASSGLSIVSGERAFTSTELRHWGTSLNWKLCSRRVRRQREALMRRTRSWPPSASLQCSSSRGHTSTLLRKNMPNPDRQPTAYNFPLVPRCGVRAQRARTRCG